MKETFDWYAMLDRLDDTALLQELEFMSKDDLKIVCINLIRGWAFQQKQNEIMNEQFYRELVRLLNE